MVKKLSSNGAEENLGMKVQPDGCNIRHLESLKNKIETWTSKVQLLAKAVWQSNTQTQQLWTSMKYGLSACSAPLEELENGLGTTDFYLTSRLGVVRNILKVWSCLFGHFGPSTSSVHNLSMPFKPDQV